MSALLAFDVTVAAAAGTQLQDTTDVTSLSLEELGSIKVPTVVGASKYEQKITEAPSIVTVVSREDMQTFGFRTLGDVLNSVRGFYITTDRAYNYTGLRGVNRPGDFGGRVLINIDGHRLNEPIYDSAFTSTDFLLDLDLVDRVEVIRGPGSSLYGNNAFFTVINVVTRRGSQLDGTELSGSAGTYDTHTGRLSFGRRFHNGVEVLVSGSYLESRGHDQFRFPEYEAINHGVVEDHDRTEARSAFASVTYRDFQFEGGYLNRRKDNPTPQYGAVFNDPTAFNLDRRAYAELKFSHAFAEDWSLEARLYYDDYSYASAFAFPDPTGGNGAPTINKDTGKARWYGGEALASKVFAGRHHVIVGAEFRRDCVGRIANFDEDPYTSYLDANRPAVTHAVYAQADLALHRQVSLNGGIRYDHFSGARTSLNPRGALNVRPWSDGILKLIYGQAFRAPNLYELEYIQPTFKANPRLAPEKIRSYELGYEQALPGGLRAGASLFASEIRGLVGQQTDATDGLNYFDNLDSVRSRGFELEVEGRWSSGVRARASYTLARARDAQTGATLENSPRHLAKFHLALPLFSRRMSVGLEALGMSRRPTVSGAEIGGNWTGNLTLFSRKLLPGCELSAGVYNILDREVRDPVNTDFAPLDTVPNDGRTFRVQVTRRF